MHCNVLSRSFLFWEDEKSECMLCEILKTSGFCFSNLIWDSSVLFLTVNGKLKRNKHINSEFLSNGAIGPF